LAQGVAGLSLPEFKQQVSAASRVAGQRYLGTTWGARDVILSVHVGDQAAARVGSAWRALDDAWWASLSPEQPGVLAVTSDTGTRSLSCRLASAPDPTYGADPSLQGFASYQVTLESDSPWWVGPDVPVSVLYATAQANYYGGSGGTGFGPPFYIAPSNQSSNATISNPGDRPAYTRWSFTGPGSITFEIGGHLTSLPPLASGQEVTVDTNPLNPNAVRDVTGGGSVNFWPFMGAHDFWVPVPARAVGFPIPITFNGGAVGVTSASVVLTPLYGRAW
jgi:hypothetical protein